MSDPALRADIFRLFHETARAHAAAAQDRDHDADWPLWYARHLERPLSDLMGERFHQAQLVHWLMDLDTEHDILDPASGWADYVTDAFLERFAASDTPQGDELALYYTPMCGYCHRVLRVIDDLDLDVELRNTMMDREHWQALMDARGLSTVPVLRINSPDGEERWMPESLDIIHYLERTYGEQ